jgi:hypothetical protein
LVGSRRAHALSFARNAFVAANLGACFACSDPKVVFAPTERSFAAPHGLDSGTVLATREVSLDDATPSARALVGVWRDGESNTDFAIALHGGVPMVESAVDDDDGETYVVVATTYQSGHLGWSIRVGSTGVTVRYECGGIADGKLDCQWWASGTSGKESLVRVSGGEDVPR